MDWFFFLKYFLFAVGCTLAVWFTIKIGFRSSPDMEEVPPEPTVRVDKFSRTETERQLYWNFTAVLIVVPALLLVLGITMQTAAWNHPVTMTLAGGMPLIWGMAFWTGMLSFREQASGSPLSGFAAHCESPATDESVITRTPEFEERS
ncbi:MAG TPA: hypothetical protein DDZ90_02070 [Planctomycetaceae bacterium]|nr:hypothetical protein [Planctomycetaceae bacterium]